MAKKIFKTTPTERKVIGAVLAAIGVISFLGQIFSKNGINIISLFISVIAVFGGIELFSSGRECSAETANKNRVWRIVYGVLLIVFGALGLFAVLSMRVFSVSLMFGCVMTVLYAVMLAGGVLLVIPVEPTFEVTKAPEDKDL